MSAIEGPMSQMQSTPPAPPAVNLTCDELVKILDGRIDDLKRAVALVAGSESAMLERRIKHLWARHRAIHSVIHNFVAAKQEMT